MPHKINPIDFENAEGNIKFVTGMLESLCRELPDSRMQRDLSDSTMERNFGTVFAHCLIAYESIEKGLGKIVPNEILMKQELNEHPEILAEAYQLMLKKHGVEDAYEQLKKLTRGEEGMTLEIMHQFLDKVDIPHEEKDILRALTPETYLGLAPKLATGFDIVDTNYKLKEL